MALVQVRYNNCDAATGFGQFDLNVIPPATLEVIVKVYFDVDNNLPAFNTGAFLNAWQANVSTIWDNKIRIKLDEQNGETLTTRFVIQEVNGLAGCHFPVYLQKGYAQDSGVKFPKVGKFGGNRIYLSLMDQDNLPYYQAAAASIQSGVLGAARVGMFFDEQQRVFNIAGQGPATITLNRLPNGWEVALGSRALLNNICAAIAATPDYLPQPPIKITAASGLTTKATALAQTVVNYMRARGVTAPTTVANAVTTKKKFKMPFTSHKPTATVTLEVLAAGEMYKRLTPGTAVADYVVTAHEFGHLLGLVDEYLDYSSMTNLIIKNSQPLWDNLCDQHQPQVTKRDWHGKFNDSIMSVGTRVFKCHAVTIWEALATASGTDWKIVAPV
jgi:hypothetical protein